MTAVTLPALQGCWKSQVWIEGAEWPAKFCTQTGSIQNGMGGEEVDRCQNTVTMMKGRRRLLLLVMTRMTMTMTLIISYYRFCTQTEQ